MEDGGGKKEKSPETKGLLTPAVSSFWGGEGEKQNSVRLRPNEEEGVGEETRHESGQNDRQTRSSLWIFW